jgi:glycosyltransferase involved in cell wall biosynthesis
MKKLLASGSQAQLHLFGAGSMEKSLHFLGRGAERNIQIHGVADTTTVRNYMSCCHWLIIPSRIESIPLIFGDALQMRIPVIGTEVGDLGNLIRSLNVGRVAAAADPETLAQLMMEVESQPRPREAWGWEEARTLFDPDLIVQSCCRALEQASR